MADRKKMSVAEILAAARARKAGGAAGGDAEAASAVGEPPTPAEPEATPAGDAAAKPTPAMQPAVGSGGGRPSVAEIMKRARQKSSGEAPAAEKPAVPVASASAQPQSKPSAKAKPARPVPPKPTRPPGAKTAPAADDRRGFLAIALGSFMAVGFTALAVTGGLLSLGLARFLFPNVLAEPPSRFKVGFKEAFPAGKVETKYVAQYGVWVANSEFQGAEQIYALKTVCTHLGCTPNWLEAEQKFKCPCHGSGFYKDGVNFEGPAPRPLDRYAIRISDDGQLEVDKSRTFQEELGQWSDPASYVTA